MALARHHEQEQHTHRRAELGDPALTPLAHPGAGDEDEAEPRDERGSSRVRRCLRVAEDRSQAAHRECRLLLFGPRSTLDPAPANSPATPACDTGPVPSDAAAMSSTFAWATSTRSGSRGWPPRAIGGCRRSRATTASRPSTRRASQSSPTAASARARTSSSPSAPCVPGSRACASSSAGRSSPRTWRPWRSTSSRSTSPRLGVPCAHGSHEARRGRRPHRRGRGPPQVQRAPGRRDDRRRAPLVRRQHQPPRMAFLAEDGRYAGSLTPGDVEGDLDPTRPAADVAHHGPTVLADAPATEGNSWPCGQTRAASPSSIATGACSGWSR